MSEMEARSPAADETHEASKFDRLGRHVVSRTGLSQNFGQAIRAELIGSNACSALGITARGNIKTTQLGRLKRVPSASLKAKLGLDEAAS